MEKLKTLRNFDKEEPGRLAQSVGCLIRKSDNVEIKCMQEFTFAINVQCPHSSLHAKLLMHNCAHAKHAKTCFCSIQRILKNQLSGK